MNCHCAIEGRMSEYSKTTESLTLYVLCILYIQVTVYGGGCCVHTKAKTQCTGISISLNILFAGKHTRVFCTYQPEGQIVFVLVSAVFQFHFSKGQLGVFLNNEGCLVLFCFVFPHLAYWWFFL